MFFNKCSAGFLDAPEVSSSITAIIRSAEMCRLKLEPGVFCTVPTYSSYLLRLRFYNRWNMCSDRAQHFVVSKVKRYERLDVLQSCYMRDVDTALDIISPYSRYCTLEHARKLLSELTPEVIASYQDVCEALIDIHRYSGDSLDSWFFDDFQEEEWESQYACECIVRDYPYFNVFVGMSPTAIRNQKQLIRGNDRSWAFRSFPTVWVKKYECHHDWDSKQVFLYFLTPEEHKAYHREFGR